MPRKHHGSVLSEKQMYDNNHLKQEEAVPRIVRKGKRQRPEVDTDLEEVDDTAELQQRLAQKVVEQHEAYQSPSNTGSVTRLDRQSSQSGYTSEQIAEHYRSAMDLYARNRINKNNAFQLKLIESLPHFTRNVENFQAASSTVEAASKIYAYRVDAVHQETQKISGGFNRIEKGRPEKDADDGASHSGDTPTKPKKRKKTGGKPTIELNEKNINMTANDVEYEDDSLFRKICSNFDEGALTGLLLNQVRSAADGRHLMLHSLSEPPREDIPPVHSDNDNVDKLFGLLDSMSSGPEAICASIADFQFTKWVRDESPVRQNGDDDSILHRSTGGSPKRPSAFQAVLKHQDSFSQGQPQDNVLPMEVDDDWVDDDQHVPEPQRRFSDANVTEVLSEKPLDYGYFDQNKMITYKGPSHWKIRKNKNSATPKRQVAKRPRATKKKEPIVEFDESMRDAINRKIKKVPEEEIQLANSTIQRRATTSYELDEETFDKDSFLRCSFPDKPGCMGRFGRSNSSGRNSKAEGQTTPTPADVPAYDYDNPNDSQNFCPDVSVGSDSFDPADDQPGPSTAPDTAPVDEGLIPEPKKVTQIKVDYAKRQKTIDARRLKREMWGVLRQGQEDAEDAGLRESSSFEQVCQRLPERLPTASRQDLSVPIAFVIFLHLCNEHTLQLSQGENDGVSVYNNFNIKQG